MDLAGIAKACGYASAVPVSSPEALRMELEKNATGPRLVEVRVLKGARKDLGRPKESPQENKQAFMQFVAE